MMLRSVVVGLSFSSLFALGCAGMVVGSQSWFEKKKPDVEPMAATDLGCNAKPIDFVAVSMNDYREVEARGCGKKARYRMIKIGFVEKWEKSTDVSSL